MFTHTHTGTPAIFGAVVRAICRSLWLFITTFFSLLLRITRGLLKFIGISMLFMTDMW